MSERNVQLYRRSFAAFEAHDDEALVRLFDPNGEFHSRFATVGGVTVYRGHEGMRSYRRDIDHAWTEIRIEVDAYFDLGEQTLAFYTLLGRGRRSGVETSMWFAQVARWRDGRIVYAKAYVDREEALTELGVSEDELEPIAP